VVLAIEAVGSSSSPQVVVFLFLGRYRRGWRVCGWLTKIIFFFSEERMWYRLRVKG